MESEQHALFQNPNSDLELTPFKAPSKAFKAAEITLAPLGLVGIYKR